MKIVELLDLKVYPVNWMQFSKDILAEAVWALNSAPGR